MTPFMKTIASKFQKNLKYALNILVNIRNHSLRKTVKSIKSVPARHINEHAYTKSSIELITNCRPQKFYHVKALFDHNNRTLEGTHLEALVAAIQSGKRKSQKLKNKKDKPPQASSSTNSTSLLIFPPPRTLSSTTSHPQIHLHRHNQQINGSNFQLPITYFTKLKQKLKHPLHVSHPKIKIKKCIIKKNLKKKKSKLYKVFS